MRSDAIVVRVLRIVEPPRLRPLEDLQRDIPAVSPELLAKLEPREGEVLRVVGWGGEPEPCGWRVDESTARWQKVKEGFQVLYENEAYTATMST